MRALWSQVKKRDFFPKPKGHFCKMDIFKNVQNRFAHFRLAEILSFSSFSIYKIKYLYNLYG